MKYPARPIPATDNVNLLANCSFLTQAKRGRVCARPVSGREGGIGWKSSCHSGAREGSEGRREGKGEREREEGREGRGMDKGREKGRKEVVMA